MAAAKWALIRPFFVILVLHALAVYLFTRGFLLTRTELSFYSQCSDAALAPCAPPAPASGVAEEPSPCWTAPAVGRLVIIVLDAIRFDFVAPSTFFEEAKPWMDKLRVLQKLASGEVSSARIFKAIADPPTTSLQRLKGLTTGGLPTFIDVGNSFGAPAITEDNLIHQLVRNGKRVLMMGDDTWLQLFPNHFHESYPYPSFNVKDLDTVDNGVNEHLVPSLYKDDWDVLIAHFLGVDHAGHIFGVDSTQMVQKLEQYNTVLEKVVEVLKNQSGPGDRHENTFLLVMGDHGQTINGDHGGGTAEEVETSLFAMSLRSLPASLSSILDAGFCKMDLDGEKICIGTFHQLDFAATVAALLGIPFPFGSIGRVNPEVYALSAGTWEGQRSNAKNCKSWSILEAWMQNYANALCINSWQVKRYIDLYSATSIMGLPSEDLRRIAELYNHAQANWSDTMNTTCLLKNEVPDGIQESSASIFQRQIDVYSVFLESVAELARSAWTEFNLILMGAGLVIMLVSIFIHVSAIRRMYTLCQSYYSISGIPHISVRLVSPSFFVAMRAVSFLSNSYILEEGRVANFLLGTAGILNLLHSISNGKYAIEEFIFLILNIILRVGIDFGVSKQAIGSITDLQFLSILGLHKGLTGWMAIFEILPIVMLSILVFILYKSTSALSCWNHFRYLFVIGTIFSYMLIATHWVLEGNLIAIPIALQDIGRNWAPRLVYAVGFGQLVLLPLSKHCYEKESVSNLIEGVVFETVALISTWSSTIMILLGKQGPFVYLLSISGAWCIIRSHKVAQIGSTGVTSKGVGFDPISVTQWNLLSVCLFFYTGHWCAFDGLRYGAAFVGFDNFNIIRQGLLLAIDTFGVSHIIPILGLPFLVAFQYRHSKGYQLESTFFLNLSQVFLSYGLITAVTTTFSIICVTIQRRHLMVWGLFAPKYVFDVVGLLLTDILICLASLYYY